MRLLWSILTGVSLVLAPGATAVGQGEADLEVTKTVDVAAPAAGSPVEFTVTLTNLGPDEATAIEAIDRLPPGLSIPVGMAPFVSQGVYDPLSGVWEVGDLAGLGSAVLTVPALAEPSANPTCHVNIAQVVSTSANDPQMLNNWSVTGVYASGATDCARLTLVSSVRRSPRTGSPTVELDVEVWNDGPDTAKGVGLRLDGVENVGFMARDSFFGDVLAGHVLYATASWTYNCGLAAFTERYRLSIYTDSTAAGDSILAITDTISVPATGACGGVGIGDALEQAFSTSSGCFIATAAYGSDLHEHVAVLRDFRDKYLVTNAAGRWIVERYYRYSPQIAAIVAGNEWLRTATRWALEPAVFAVLHPFTAAAFLLLPVIGLMGARWRRKMALMEGD